MAHLRRLGPQLVSPTPIRPHSPAGSPSRSRAPANPAARAGAAPPRAAARFAHLRAVRATERLTGAGCGVCRERGGTPRQKAAFLGCDGLDGDDEAAGEMCSQELIQIFAGSPRSAPPGPTDCSAGGHGMVQPPSRNQNPLVKDQVPCPPPSASDVARTPAPL